MPLQTPQPTRDSTMAKLHHVFKQHCTYFDELYGAPFVKILYLTDLAQILLSLAEIAISACRDVICGRDSYLCMQRYYLWQR